MVSTDADFRKLIQETLHTIDPTLYVCGSAGDQDHAFTVINRIRTSHLVVDIDDGIGLELIRRMRIPLDHKIPVCVLHSTPLSPFNLKWATEVLQVVTMISKPVNAEVLEEKLAEYLGKCKLT